MVLQPLLLLLMISPAAQADTASAPAEEMRLIEDLFGKHINEALATPDSQSKLQVAGDMLNAARDESNPASLRVALAGQILRVLRDVLTPEASRIIHGGLAIKQQLQPVDSAAELQAELDIFTRRYGLARQQNADAETRQQAAREVLTLSQQLAKLQADTGKYDAAVATLTAAKQVARGAKFPQEELQIDEALQQLSAQRLRAGRLASLQQKLTAAKAAGDAEQIRAAQVQLGLFYLQAEGDVRKAADALVGTNHGYELALKALADFLNNPKSPPPPEVCNGIAEAVADMARSAENPKAQAAIAAAGEQMCQATIAQNPQGLATTKTKLLLAQLDKLTAESPADKLIRALKTNYGGFEGKLEKSTAGPSATILYDFTNSRQLADWETRAGKWEINASRSQLVSAPGTGLARLDSRLKFRGNQPITLTFQASGKQDLDATFSFRTNGQHDVEFLYGSRTGPNVLQNIIKIDSRPQFMAREQLDPSQTYRFSIAWDGQGNFTWSVNGKEIAQVGTPPGFAELPVTISLLNRQQPMLLKDVKIDGVVIENPNAAASQPASAPPQAGPAASPPDGSGPKANSSPAGAAPVGS